MELPHIHKLTKPVPHGEESVSELTFRRAPVAKDLRGMSLRELDKADNLITLVGRLTDTPPSVIERVEMVDLLALLEVVTAFLPSGPRTGSAAAD